MQRHTDPSDAPGDDFAARVAQLEVERDRASFECDVERAKTRRLQGQLDACESNLLAVRAEKEILLHRLRDLTGYVDAIHTSRGWKVLERARGFLRRRWRV